MSDTTPEQKARDMLERMGVENAQGFSAGEVVELANLIAEIERLREENTGLMLALENSLGRVVYEAPPGMVMVPAPRKKQKQR